MMKTAAQNDAEAGRLEDLLADDLDRVRMGQAELLRTRAPLSCLIVEAVIVYFTALIMIAGDYVFATIWLAVASALVGVVYLYPRFAAPAGITASNFRGYLRGHIAISTLTGLVWSGFAIAYLDPNSLLNLFITINIVCSITFGGMMPSAEYRPTFIGLSTAMLIPFAVYWLASVDGPLRFIAIGLVIFYGFGLLVSARSEIQTIQSLAADRNRRLSELLRAQNRLVEKASAEKSRFLATTSHDMSQPLQAQGFFLRALRTTLHQPDQLELLDKIEASWSSQQSLLRALVETARLDSGAIIPNVSAFELAYVLQGLQAEFVEAADAKSIDLAISTGTVGINSDPLLVTRILRNLLSNAIKFTQVGGRVALDWREDGDRIVITVSDNGPGVTNEQRDQIFEEYVQLESAHSGSQRGLGLGLTIVSQLAAKLGTPLTFESQPGTGTQASISLQRARGIMAKAKPSPSISQIPNAPLIVLVEDEADVRDSLSILLTSWGCRVIAAASGADAIALVSWSDVLPAVIIADKRLADGEDGLAAALSLREDTLLDIPIVLLTGDIHQFEHVSDVPGVSVLAKPADAEELFAALGDALENSATG